MLDIFLENLEFYVINGFVLGGLVLIFCFLKRFFRNPCGIHIKENSPIKETKQEAEEKNKQGHSIPE